MAMNGKYPIGVRNRRWGEVVKSASVQECWGGEDRLNTREWLRGHSLLCDGQIRLGSLYVRRHDRRDNAVVWRVSMFCAVKYHPDELLADDSELSKYVYVSTEDLSEAKENLLRLRDRLDQMCAAEDPTEDPRFLYPEVQAVAARDQYLRDYRAACTLEFGE